MVETSGIASDCWDMANDRDTVLVNGFIKRYASEVFPLEILELVLQWYHIPFCIEYFELHRVGIMNKEKTKIRHFKYALGSTSYGSIIMPSFDNNIIYEYTIRIIEGNNLSIGLTDALFLKTNGSFYNSTFNKFKYYVFNTDTKGLSTVKLIYNAYAATLSLEIDDKPDGLVYETHKAEELNYRLAIYMKKKVCLEIEHFTAKVAESL